MISEVCDLLEKEAGIRPLPISSVSQTDLKPLLSAGYQHVDARRAKEVYDRNVKEKLAAVERGEIDEIGTWSPAGLVRRSQRSQDRGRFYDSGIFRRDSAWKKPFKSRL